MLTKEENELLTKTGPDTPCGELLRRYWEPVALAEELPVGGAPLAVRLLGEDLVLFRDEAARPGLLGIHCSHRGADLSYGRLEDGGLRCIYHGWLYDIHGRCLEQPGERLRAAAVERTNQPTDEVPSPALGPAEFHERIRQTAYPCVERGGMILAYLGPGEPPLVPSYGFLEAPEDHIYAVKLYSDCNYLQGNEGNVDLLHVSFLHYSNRDVQEQSLGRAPNGAANGLNNRGAAPFQERCEAELAQVGLRVCKIRTLNPEEDYVRIGTFILPNLTATPGGQTNWHVPIDDEHHWKYTIMFSADGPIDRERVSRVHTMDSSYHPIANKANRYQQDRSSMNTVSYSGIHPSFFQQQDLCATEGAGVIQDRTQEHLAPSDAAIVVSRKLISSAIKDVQEGRDPPHVIRDPSRNRVDVVTTFGVIPTGTWKDHCHQLLADGRGWTSRPGAVAPVRPGT